MATIKKVRVVFNWNTPDRELEVELKPVPIDVDQDTETHAQAVAAEIKEAVVKKFGRIDVAYHEVDGIKTYH